MSNARRYYENVTITLTVQATTAQWIRLNSIERIFNNAIYVAERFKSDYELDLERADILLQDIFDAKPLLCQLTDDIRNQLFIVELAAQNESTK